MQEKIVYLLGAGFSAPLGLPVMSNFFFKSRDQYFQDPENYSYFTKVFEIIRKLGDVKNYFKADLFNIEEILSILEMQRHLGQGEAEAHDYTKYLCDVVQYYTPTFEPGNIRAANWHENFLHRRARGFGNFVACLFNLNIMDKRRDSPPQMQLSASRENDPQNVYSVVTLNYDLVLEKLCELICSVTNIEMAFCTDQKNLDDKWIGSPYLAKLHGTVESAKVIPPTWNKGLHSGMTEVWQLAYKLLSTATQIRVIGYSLAETDSYVKYLLKSAIMEARNFKQIDVMCLDPEGGVKARYDEFIHFPNYRFASMDVSEYLGYPVTMDHERKTVKYDFLERLHGQVSW